MGSHSNTITLTDQSNTISGITYVDGSLVISQGQPSSPPPSISQKGNVFTITLQAGRSKTSAVANGFNAACGGASHEYAPSGGGGTPDELNFYFEVTIQFQVGGSSASANAYIAQGSYGVTNNWWIGSGSVSNSGQPQLVFTAGSQRVTIPLSGTHDSFTLGPASVAPNSPITHVFVLMLENHSFDNMFALSRIRGLNVATSDDNNSYNGTTYPFQGGAPSSMPTDPGHEFTDVVVQLAGAGQTYPSGGPYPAINNSGFAANYATTTTEGPAPPPADIGDIMKGFDTPNDLPAIYQLATQFAICDQWFSSLPGPTWPNRFFVHGASSAGLDHSPSTGEILKWETVSGFTYPNGSIFDAMTAAKISYGLFNDTSGPLAGSIAQVSALHNIQMRDVKSLSDFVQELQSGSYSYQYTFIEPNYGDITSGTYEGGSSQHPMDSVAGGEQLIQTVYNAIRNSNVWNNSLLIITYDEHGGFYDHVAPGGAVPPNDGSSGKYNEYGFTFDQLGVRVPAVIVSPWIAAGTIDPTVYDHSSVLATVEALFGLGALTQRDANANNLLHLISSNLRADCPTSLTPPAPAPKRPALTAEQRAALERQPVPQTGNLPGFLAIMLKTELELSGGTPAERTAVVAKFQTIKTRGEARAYIESVLARATGRQAQAQLASRSPA